MTVHTFVSSGTSHADIVHKRNQSFYFPGKIDSTVFIRRLHKSCFLRNGKLYYPYFLQHEKTVTIKKRLCVVYDCFEALFLYASIPIRKKVVQHCIRCIRLVLVAFSMLSKLNNSTKWETLPPEALPWVFFTDDTKYL